MTPAERQQALSSRAPENQQRILAKVEEYEALSPDDRVLLLQATELRWHLVPLLSLPAARRAAALKQIPPDLRPLVETRLEQWQILPPPIQEQILDDDQKLQLYLQLEASSPQQRQVLLQTLPPGKRQELEGGFARWVKLPAADREKTLGQFNQFFELTPEEKEKVLATLSEPERHQMEITLRAFEKLPGDQRAQCIRAFGKFASMGADERRQFLRNAERWQAMTPAERERWRDLVRDVPQWPPLPPGFDASVPQTSPP